ncbi:hypothetical protein Pmani_035529 [Petrolisthes manimaculis]|uniref:Uncharacterized protein n=1 Tax=Petrolisthes manimaculis TaxID=1843537 RepID=A0AAE1NM94_9EUCA|nr:hypothetical protein Pmani_035529 [Petrolisthes manimaculis]
MSVSGAGVGGGGLWFRMNGRRSTQTVVATTTLHKPQYYKYRIGTDKRIDMGRALPSSGQGWNPGNQWQQLTVRRASQRLASSTELLVTGKFKYYVCVQRRVK